MNQTQSILLILFILFVFLSAFFSMSETAILSVNKIHLRTLEDEGNLKAKKMNQLLDKQDALISTILVGNNIVNIAASSLTTSLVLTMFPSEGLGVALSTGIVTIIILIFGEITPKSFATKNADKIVLKIVNILKFFMVLFAPIVTILNSFTNVIVSENEAPTMTEEDLKTMATVSHEEGVLEEEEKVMIHNVVEFGDTELKEIMTPRVNVISVSDDVTYNELIKVIRECEFSRIPVHSENYDEIVGVLYVKDLLLSKVVKGKFNIKEFMKEPFILYEFNQLSDAFDNMRKEHASFAVVLDEYGVMSGIVTIEDIIEEIVGDIDDEYDDENEHLIDDRNGYYIIDGICDIDEVNEVCHTSFESEEFESIGGLILGITQGTIEEGEEIDYQGCHFVIQSIDKNRISKLKLEVNK